MQKHSNYILFGITIALMSVYVPIIYIAPFLIIGLGIFFSLSLVLHNCTDSREYSFLLNIFIMAFFLRIVVALLLYNFIFLSNSIGLSKDGWPYSENGYKILQLWINGIRDVSHIDSRLRATSLSGTLGSYDFWNAVVYYFTGKSPVSLVFINCLASSLTVILIYRITKQLYNEKAARISAILTAFWPSLFIWSIQNLKESLSIFLIAVLMWVMLQLKVKFKFYLLFLTVLVSIALKELRLVSFLMFYAVIFPVSLILFLWKKNRVLFIFLLLLAGTGLFIAINHYLTNRSLLEYINYMRTVRAYGNTAFLSNMNISNPISFICFAPIALLVAWLSPFPWQIGSMSQIIAIPEMLLYYSLLPVIFLGAGFIMRYKIREGGIIIVYIFIMMLVLAFIEGNIGTLFRHRAMVLLFMFVLAGIGLEKVKFKITAHD